MGSEALDESDGAGTFTDEHIFFGGKRIARRNISSGNIFYYFADHLGTSRAIVQEGQSNPCYDADFYPFGGEAAVATNTCSQNYKFTGKERDSESGLDHFGARYYASNFARFLSVDPSRLSVYKANPQSWNRYAYTQNNPLAYVDRNGKWPTSVHNDIINRAFTNLGEDERDILKRASKVVDKDQSMRGSHKHGLHSPFESSSAAARRGDAFIADNLQKAVSSQMKWEKDNWAVRDRIGNSPEALEYFGTALHTVTDRTSPWHNNQDVGTWYSWLIPGASLGHAAGELALARSAELAQTLAINEAQVLWAQYQTMLADARKKEQEEEERKKKEEEEANEPKP